MIYTYRYHLVTELRKAYPYQFHNTNMALPTAWFSLLGIVAGLIDERLEKAGFRSERSKSMVFGGWSQVKEKFAGARLYTHYVKRQPNAELAESIYQLIMDAEEISFNICHECGMPGEPRDDLSWYSTLCESHYKEALKRQ